MKNNTVVNMLMLIVAGFFLIILIGVASDGPEDYSFVDSHYKEVTKVKKYYEENRPDGSYLIDPTITVLDDLTFREAFRIARAIKGTNTTYYWNGREFSTNKE